MVTEFPLPDIGEGLAEAEIVRWLVAPGDTVRADEEFIEVETDKAVVGITSPVTGTLVRHGADEGDLVAVGALLAVFDDGGDAGASPGAGSEPSRPEVAAVTAAPSTAEATSPASADAPHRKPKATPATRKLARSLSIDLTQVEGTGPGGRIVDADVERAAAGATAPAAEEGQGASGPVAQVAPEASPAPTPAAAPTPAFDPPAGEDRHVPLRGIRRVVSRTMTESWTTVPHVNSIHEVDLHALQRLRAELKEAGTPIPVTAFLAKAVARALRTYPVLNAEVSRDGEEMILKHRVNLGVAVDAPDGLIVPVIDDADVKPVATIGAELTRLAAQARDRSVPQERLRGGTFTVNNYGPLGGWFGTSLIKPPEVAILSMGPAREQVVPRDGEIVIRPVAVLALAADHRVADGNEIIGFCVAVRELLEAPVRLLVEG